MVITMHVEHILSIFSMGQAQIAEIVQFLIKGQIKAYFKPFKANLMPLGQASSLFQHVG